MWIVSDATLNGSETGSSFKQVLDCFSGSGTVPLMCEKLGRNYIGIEKDKEYFEKSLKRLKAEKVRRD